MATHRRVEGQTLWKQPDPRKLKERGREDVCSDTAVRTADQRAAREGVAGNKGRLHPYHQKCTGFLAYYALDSGSGTLTSISIFEHRAGAEKSNKLAEDWVGMTLSSALPTSPEIIVGEVGAHELNLTKLGLREIIG